MLHCLKVCFSEARYKIFTILCLWTNFLNVISPLRTNMKKTILLNLSLLIFVNLLIKPIYIFGIDRKLQLIVGQSEYGFYIELLTFTLLFQALNDLGLYNYTIRHFSQTKSTDTNLVSNLFGVKLIFSVVYLAIISIITFLHHDYVDSL